MNKRHRYIAAIWIALALVMVFAAGTTVADVKGAVYKMSNQWFPAGWPTEAVVWGNFALQVVAAIGLLCTVFFTGLSRWAWLPAGGLMIGYTVYALIAYMDWAPHELCACVSLIDGMTWGQTLSLNTVLLALLLASGFAMRTGKEVNGEKQGA